MSAAFKMTASGMSSKTAPSNSIVPQGALVVCQRSRRSLTQLLLNELSSISRSSRIGSTFSGLSTSLQFRNNAC